MPYSRKEENVEFVNSNGKRFRVRQTTVTLRSGRELPVTYLVPVKQTEAHETTDLPAGLIVRENVRKGPDGDRSE